MLTTQDTSLSKRKQYNSTRLLPFAHFHTPDSTQMWKFPALTPPPVFAFVTCFYPYSCSAYAKTETPWKIKSSFGYLMFKLSYFTQLLRLRFGCSRPR